MDNLYIIHNIAVIQPMSLHQIASLKALTLPEVTVTQPFGDACDVYKVMDKIFLLIFFLDSQPVINLKVRPDHGEMLKDIYPYISSGWHMNKKHWVSIYEDEALDQTLITDLVISSYELVVSKLNKVEQKRIALLREI